MNQAVIQELIRKALAKEISFGEILATLGKEGVVTGAALVHDGVAAEFAVEKLERINQKVQAGQAAYPDFVREGTAAGCAYYIVYLNGKKVRYFGRDGGEYIQHFPGSR
jgi:uncharacterized protein YbcV (DUF1398 family)